MAQPWTSPDMLDPGEFRSSLRRAIHDITGHRHATRVVNGLQRWKVLVGLWGGRLKYRYGKLEGHGTPMFSQGNDGHDLVNHL